MAQWTAKFINDLPDSCFAYIEPGGTKDEDGLTVPRSLRHLPFKDADGNIDLPHLRNALARLGQTSLSDEAKAQAKKVLDAAAKKEKVGEFANMEESTLYNEVKLSSHDAILQKLDSWREYVSDTGTKRKLFYGVDNYSDTEPDWEKVPIIRAKAHIDDEKYELEPESAISEANGIIAGTISNTKVITEGQPRLATKFDITDPETERLLSDGKLSLSTSFKCKIGEDGKLIGKVTPKHILLFEHDQLHSPQDQGAMFLNSKSTRIFYNTEESNLTDSNEDVIQNMKEEFQNALAEKESTIETLQNELNDYRTKEAERKKLEADARWGKIKNMLPDGMTHKPEDEETLRNEYESDPSEFTVKVMEIIKNQAVESEEEGLTNTTSEPKDEADAAYDELMERRA